MTSSSNELNFSDSEGSQQVDMTANAIHLVKSETALPSQKFSGTLLSDDSISTTHSAPNCIIPGATAAPSSEACSSNPCEQRNILRGLLSQRPLPDEFSRPPPEPIERRFANIMPFLPTRTTDLASFAHRPRCQSMGANLLSLKQPPRTPSRESLDSVCDGTEQSADFSFLPNLHYQSTDNQIEATRTKLMSLTTDGGEADLSLSYGRNSSSQPGSPPRAEMLVPDRMYQHRKYSEGSQLKARLQALRMGFRTPADSSGHQIGVGSYTSPIDLTGRRRRKFEGVTGLPYGRRVSLINPVASNCSVDEGIDDDSCSESSSILKSILIGRERSNTISVCGLRSSTDPVSDLDSRRFYRQPVTLAKKNLHPVSAKISDCLSRIATFTRSLPDFTELPGTEQRLLMASALPRLLLLFMAESNVHFVVAPVLQHNRMDEFAEENKDSDDSASSSSLGSRTAGRCSNVNDTDRDGGASSDMPTLQFAECVKNFVSKCQTLAISSDEYYYMRVIALFQSAGAGTNETADVAERVNASARRDLQHLVEQTHSDDPLHRYSALLMTFHTLFSIHCGMLESLFCRPLASRVSPGVDVIFR